MIEIFLDSLKLAELKQSDKKYLLDYKNYEISKSICISLPNSQRFYTWEHRFPPYFESFLPEGYLYEIFKNLLTKKYGYVDDYLLLSILAPNLDSRTTFKSDYEEIQVSPIDIDAILLNDTQDTFNTLLHTFLNKNAISGVQPKTIAVIKDKESLRVKEYIVKTWGDEFPYLAENEYFCLKAVEKSGVEIPNIRLSKNNRFLLVENFSFKEDSILGFEEILSLMDKNTTGKYQGSYEQVSKIILQFSTDKTKSMREFYKTVVMSYMLKNGDAHLKNFGLLFSRDFSTIVFAPAYDIVTTTAYMFKDRPALTLNGKKIWHSKETLVGFGQKYCLLSKKEALQNYDMCQNALVESICELRRYIKKNPHFKSIGNRMLDSWKLSLSGEALKEVDDATIRNWH